MHAGDHVVAVGPGRVAGLAQDVGIGPGRILVPEILALPVAAEVERHEGNAPADPLGHQRHDLHLGRSEEHTSELQSLMRISYAVFCLKKKKKLINTNNKIIYNKKNKQ